VLRRKLAENGLANQVRVHVIPPGGSFDLKPFALRFIRLAHSIPEAQALVIDTPAGEVEKDVGKVLDMLSAVIPA